MLKGLGGQASTSEIDAEIAKANIEHLTKLLQTETDSAKRNVIERVLVEEELKLAAALKDRSDRRKG